MKALLFSLLIISLGYSTTLDAYCVNNATGKHKRVSKKRRTRLSCTRKTREFYAQKSAKLAKRYFRKNGNCRFCGCPSSEHRNETEPLAIDTKK